MRVFRLYWNHQSSRLHFFGSVGTRTSYWVNLASSRSLYQKGQIQVQRIHDSIFNNILRSTFLSWTITNFSFQGYSKKANKECQKEKNNDEKSGFLMSSEIRKRLGRKRESKVKGNDCCYHCREES